MSNQPSTRIRRAGAYIVKAAESRPAKVDSKSNGRTNTPSRNDKQLAEALLKPKRA